MEIPSRHARGSAPCPNMIIDRTGSLRRQHPADWQDGISGMELLIDSGNRFDPDSHFFYSWETGLAGAG